MQEINTNKRPNNFDDEINLRRAYLCSVRRKMDYCFYNSFCIGSWGYLQSSFAKHI